MRRKNDSMPHKIRTKNVVLYCIVVTILFAVALYSARMSMQQKNSSIALPDAEFQVHVLDVGQGDSILVIADGQTMLVDTAESDQADTIISYLKEHGITELDYLVSTHFHADHIGGFAQVLEAIPTKVIIDSECPDSLLPTTKTFERYLDAIEQSGAEYRTMQAKENFALGGAQVNVLAPDHNDDVKISNINNTSLVLDIRYGDAQVMLMGDAEEEEERQLLADSESHEVDFLKVGHHGSDSSSSDMFLQWAQPKAAAISCGVNNSYGHPAQVTLDKLANYTDDVYITAQDGDIVFLYDADTGTKQIITGSTAQGDTQ